MALITAERRCPFCGKNQRRSQVCGTCGADLTPLDHLRPWRQIRRFCRQLGLGMESMAVFSIAGNAVLLVALVVLVLAFLGYVRVRF
ncbi:MAG: hypothetical protein HY331_16390 [Chloroflexi bacterium]|nr:hypothetical protein [Chloroflexota bacterium]